MTRDSPGFQSCLVLDGTAGMADMREMSGDLPTMLRAPAGASRTESGSRYQQSSKRRGDEDD